MIRIATRRSALARAQAHQVGELLVERTGRPFELVPLATTGDRDPGRAIGTFDAKGLFVDAVREAVLDGRADCVVHSLKDVPTEPAAGLVLGAIPPRADPRDLLVTRRGYPLATLPDGAVVGTSSGRRAVQLRRTRPRLLVTPLRGNLDTRLGKVAAGELDAVVVALAGLQRLYTDTAHGGLGPLGLPLKAVALEPGECLPAPGQGALAVECRADDARTRSALETLDHLPSRRAVEAERALLAALGGGCLAPVGALCSLDGRGGLDLTGMVADPERGRMLRRSLQGAFDHAVQLGEELAADLLAAGGDELLASARAGARGA